MSHDGSGVGGKGAGKAGAGSAREWLGRESAGGKGRDAHLDLLQSQGGLATDARWRVQPPPRGVAADGGIGGRRLQAELDRRASAGSGKPAEGRPRGRGGGSGCSPYGRGEGAVKGAGDTRKGIGGSRAGKRVADPNWHRDIRVDYPTPHSMGHLRFAITGEPRLVWLPGGGNAPMPGPEFLADAAPAPAGGSALKRARARSNAAVSTPVPAYGDLDEVGPRGGAVRLASPEEQAAVEAARDAAADDDSDDGDSSVPSSIIGDAAQEYINSIGDGGWHWASEWRNNHQPLPGAEAALVHAFEAGMAEGIRLGQHFEQHRAIKNLLFFIISTFQHVHILKR